MSKPETVPAKAGTHIPVHAGISAGAPVATFEGYVDGEPLVKWINRASMPAAGTKLYVGATATVGAVAEVPDLAEAVRKLVKAKGRFHTEQNYKELADALTRYDARCAQGEAQAIQTEQRAVIEEAVQVFESGAAHNRKAGRSVFAHSQQGRADRLRAILAAPACDEGAMRDAFIEWHQDTFGYCCDDEKSFIDGDLQAVAWSAWQEAHARIGVKQANGEIA